MCYDRVCYDRVCYDRVCYERAFYDRHVMIGYVIQRGRGRGMVLC